MPSKQTLYAKLVDSRKKCRRCDGLPDVVMQDEVCSATGWPKNELGRAFESPRIPSPRDPGSIHASAKSIPSTPISSLRRPQGMLVACFRSLRSCK